MLISTIPHRHEMLCNLLREFDIQAQPGFGVRILRDNCERYHFASHGKRQDLIDSSSADYVCFVDDDDMVAHDYVASVMAALTLRPDYVGFSVYITMDGNPHRHASHSLKHEWTSWETTGVLLRNVTHLNPIRRELALAVRWTDQRDEVWSQAMMATGAVKTEVMIDRDMYFYRFRSGDNFNKPAQREPLPEPLPQLPEYPWLTVL